MPEKEQEKLLYATSTGVMKALDSRTGDPVVDDKLPEGKSKAQVMAEIETTVSRLMSGLRSAKPSAIS